MLAHSPNGRISYQPKLAKNLRTVQTARRDLTGAKHNLGLRSRTGIAAASVSSEAPAKDKGEIEKSNGVLEGDTYSHFSCVLKQNL